MILIDRCSSSFLKRLSLRGEKIEMNSLINQIKKNDSGDENNLVSSDLFNEQLHIYNVTLNFLKNFDKEVALSFLETNGQFRGMLGIFYDKLVREL